MHRERISQRDPQPVGDDLGFLRLTVDQYRELVATDAGQRVGICHAALEPLAHRAQQFVARGVAEPIVDLLEVVEIDEDQHELAVAHRLVEPLREQQPVRQPGQRIVMDLVRQSALRLVEAASELPLRIASRPPVARPPG